jgi:hypothetical protein
MSSFYLIIEKCALKDLALGFDVCINAKYLSKNHPRILILQLFEVSRCVAVVDD